MTAGELPPRLREQLDQVKVSILAEYLAARLDLGPGEQRIIIFNDGRYERLLPRPRSRRSGSLNEPPKG